MGDYDLQIKFSSDKADAEVQEWFDKLLTKLPKGASGSIVMEPLFVDLEDDLDAVLGCEVQFNAPERGMVQGKLDAWFNKANTGKVLVVNSKAYPLNYATITVVSPKQKEEN